MKSFMTNQMPLFVWMLLIFWLSSIPRIPTIKVPIEMDKVAHVAIFFVLCWFSFRAFRYQFRFRRAREYALLLALILTALYGVTDEYHQRFVPGRTFDYFDMAADAAGALLFASAVQIKRGWKRHQEARQTASFGG